MEFSGQSKLCLDSLPGLLETLALTADAAAAAAAGKFQGLWILLMRNINSSCPTDCWRILLLEPGVPLAPQPCSSSWSGFSNSFLSMSFYSLINFPIQFSSCLKNLSFSIDARKIFNFVHIGCTVQESPSKRRKVKLCFNIYYLNRLAVIKRN